MRLLVCGLALGLCGVVSAQEVFTNGIDVKGQMVQGVGLIEISTNNPAWTGRAPSLGQLAGVDTNENDLAVSALVPLRPAWLETDGIYARTTHTKGGEIHCATAAQRQLNLTPPWWRQINKWE